MIARLMEFVNVLTPLKDQPVAHTAAWREALDALALLLAPSAPHLAEELWEQLGGSYSVHTQQWPSYDPELARDEEFDLVLQVNGKVRDRVQAPVGISEERARELANASERIAEFTSGKTIRRVIFVPNKLVNIVVS
jgi:leucyl-tRNA synthetase